MFHNVSNSGSPRIQPRDDNPPAAARQEQRSTPHLERRGVGPFIPLSPGPIRLHELTGSPRVSRPAQELPVNPKNKEDGTVQAVTTPGHPDGPALVERIATDFVDGQHMQGIADACRQLKMAVSFREAGARTLERLKDGAAPKPHSILEKTIKDKSVAAAYGARKDEVLDIVKGAKIDGLVGAWSKAPGSNGPEQLTGIYVLADSRLLAKLTERNITCHDPRLALQARLVAKHDSEVQALRDQCEADIANLHADDSFTQKAQAAKESALRNAPPDSPMHQRLTHQHDATIARRERIAVAGKNEQAGVLRSAMNVQIDKLNTEHDKKMRNAQIPAPGAEGKPWDGGMIYPINVESAETLRLSLKPLREAFAALQPALSGEDQEAVPGVGAQSTAWMRVAYTGDYDTHDMMYYQGSGGERGTPLVGEKRERAAIDALNRHIARYDPVRRPEGDHRYHLIQHGAQVNYVAQRLVIEKEHDLVTAVAEPEFPIAMCDRGEWSMIDSADELKDFYAARKLQMKSSWVNTDVFKPDPGSPGQSRLHRAVGSRT